LPKYLVTCGAVLTSATAFALYARVEWPWFVLGWVGLVPWLAVLERTASLRAAFGLGLLMCFAFVLAVFSWFADAIQNYTGAPWPIALLVLLLLAPLMQPQLITAAVARHLARGAGAGFWRVALIGGFVYAGTEWTGPKLFGDTLGHGFYASPLMRQGADLAGAHGLTFVLWLANECILAAVGAIRENATSNRSAALAPMACVTSLVLVLLAYGTVRYRQLSKQTVATQPVRAGLVQADISQYARLRAEMGTHDAVRMILDSHFALSVEALSSGTLDLLVWPETVYPTTFGVPKSEAGAAFDREIQEFVGATRVPLVFGSYDVENGEEFNAAVFLRPESSGVPSFDAYRKAWLFPFTERVPAILDSDLLRGWMPWLGTWKPGKEAEAIAVRLPDHRVVRVAPLICYDAVDPGLVIAAVRKGAELIVTLSNDSWFAEGNGPRLHLIVSAFRSLETRRPQIRATNTGISAVFTATGELLGTVAVHQRAPLVASVYPAREAWTLMLAWGNWFGPTALAAGVLMMVGLIIRGPTESGPIRDSSGRPLARSGS
jgi:apolipoprotein N-acyltransferase